MPGTIPLQPDRFFCVCYRLPSGWFVEPSLHGTTGSQKPALADRGGRVAVVEDPESVYRQALALSLRSRSIPLPTSHTAAGEIGNRPDSRVSTSGCPQPSVTDHRRGLAPSYTRYCIYCIYFMICFELE